jgi:hypothetical protein
MTAAQDVTLNCREAQLILKVIPLAKSYFDMNKEEFAAVKHYTNCKNCRDQGLAEILDDKLSCQQAILVWARYASALWLDITWGLAPFSLYDLYAIEHVWGKYEWQNSMGGHGWNSETACHEHACLEFHYYWQSVPMSSSAGDGENGVIHLFPQLFKIFQDQNWPLDDLLSVQKQRIYALLADIKSGNVSISPGHYHSIENVMSEMREHIKLLQNLAVHTIPKIEK